MLINLVSLVPLGWGGGAILYSKNTVTRQAKTSTCYLLFKWATTASAIICSPCTFTPNYSTDCYMMKCSCLLHRLLYDEVQLLAAPIAKLYSCNWMEQAKNYSCMRSRPLWYSSMSKKTSHLRIEACLLMVIFSPLLHSKWGSITCCTVIRRVGVILRLIKAC